MQVQSRPPSGWPALVLNADFRPLSYYPLSIWPWEEAIKAVYQDRVDVVSTYDKVVRSPSMEMVLPSVIALKNYVDQDRQPAFTRFNVFLRDGFTCQYCSASAELTFDHVVPTDEVLARIRAVDALEPDAGPARGNGPAVYYRYPGAAGTVGVITPMTHTYCERCNRVRLTADGRLRTCLFGDHEVLLRDAIRSGTPLAPLFLQALAEKPKAHELLQMRVGGLRALSQVGG